MKPRITILLLFLLFFACKTDENNKKDKTQMSVDKDEEKDIFVYVDNIEYYRENPDGITVNFYNDSELVDIYYKNENSSDFDKKSMTKNKDLWTVNIQAKALEFYFVDSQNITYNIGGTMGSYPGDPEENFRTTYKEVWVKNNIVLPYEYNLKPENNLLIMTVNLHTYQEENQNEKFELLVKAISDLKPDTILLQECAQNKEAEVVNEDHYGKIIRKDNMAKIISDMLKQNYDLDYDYFWDWSHYGWSEWEEGLAVMTRHKILNTADRYVTSNKKKNFWKSRNIIKAKIDIENIGPVDFYSIHTGWWGDKPDPFKTQFENLINWIDASSDEITSVILCGDFNIESGTEGYKYIEDKNRFTDVYRYANPHGLYDPTIGGNIDGWKDGMQQGRRIDYIFIDKNKNFDILQSQRIFTEKTYGRVSDHVGLYAVLEYIKDK